MALTTSVIGITTAITIIVLIRKDHLHVRYGMWWIAVAAAFALLGVFPQTVDFFGAKLGIAYPPILAVIVALTLIVLKILVMDIERSRNQIRIQRLVQRVALLESELRESQAGADENEVPNPASTSRNRNSEPPVA